MVLHSEIEMRVWASLLDAGSESHLPSSILIVLETVLGRVVAIAVAEAEMDSWAHSQMLQSLHRGYPLSGQMI